MLWSKHCYSCSVLKRKPVLGVRGQGSASVWFLACVEIKEWVQRSWVILRPLSLPLRCTSVLFGKWEKTSLSFFVTYLPHTAFFSTSWYGLFCVNNDISKPLLMQMEISDSADMLCTFFEIYKHCGSHVLKFVCDSLCQTSRQHVLTLCYLADASAYLTCFPASTFRRIRDWTIWQSKATQTIQHVIVVAEADTRPARTENICEKVGQRSQRCVLWRWWVSI